MLDNYVIKNKIRLRIDEQEHKCCCCMSYIFLEDIFFFSKRLNTLSLKVS